jgi:hypothetical protein
VSECGKEICRVLCVRKTARADGPIGSRGHYHGSCWATGGFLARLCPVLQKGIAPDTYLFHLATLLARGCKRRWELAAGTRELPRPPVNEITNLPPQNVTARMSR